MLKIGLCHQDSIKNLPEKRSLKEISLFNEKFYVGYIEEDELIEPPQADQVRVKVNFFSINFRDKSAAFHMAKSQQSQFIPMGSDFCGEVLETGSDVLDFKVGDIVIPNHHYDLSDKAIAPGLAHANCGQSEIIVPSNKIIKKPQNMPDEIGAIFSVGFQTAGGMINKAGELRNKRILITGATSHTSLCLMSLLKGYQIAFDVMTSSTEKVKGIQSLQCATSVLCYESSEFNAVDKKLLESGYDIIFDPFFDFYYPLLNQYLGYQGSYITCGIGEQSVEQSLKLTNYSVGHIIAAQHNLIGNCLGLTEDLLMALEMYEQQKFFYPLESHIKVSEIEDFLVTNSTAKENFRKEVFRIL